MTKPARSGSPQSPAAPVCPPDMTPAHFTARELDELRKICRDADSELGRRFLEAGLNRAKPPLPYRQVDEIAGPR